MPDNESTETCILDKPYNKLTENIFGSEVAQIGEGKWILNSDCMEELHIYHNFQVRSDDVWVMSLPRCGSHYTQEAIWLIANNFNYDMAKLPLEMRFPYFESKILYKIEGVQRNIRNCPRPWLKECLLSDVVLSLENMPFKRFIKTHLPFELLPSNLLESSCKIIYVARNPKDVAVSYYHFAHYMQMVDPEVTFSDFWNCFQNDLIWYTPYWTHVLQAWDKRNNPNVLFLFYEDITKDPDNFIKTVSGFLGVHVDNEQCKALKNHLSFENFQKNPSVNFEQLEEGKIAGQNGGKFIRSGKSGGWKTYFTDELNQQADEWINNNLKNTDLRFPVY